MADEWKKVGVVGVDSGRLLLTDYPTHPTVQFEALFERLEMEGVYTLTLSDYVVRELNLEVEGFVGRGFQAQANAEAIKEKLGWNES